MKRAFVRKRRRAVESCLSDPPVISPYGHLRKLPCTFSALGLDENDEPIDDDIEEDPVFDLGLYYETDREFILFFKMDYFNPLRVRNDNEEIFDVEGEYVESEEGEGVFSSVDLPDVNYEPVPLLNEKKEPYGQCPTSEQIAAMSQYGKNVKVVRFPTPAYYSSGFSISMEKFISDTAKELQTNELDYKTLVGFMRCALRSYIYIIPPTRNTDETKIAENIEGSGILLWDPLFIFHEALCDTYLNFEDLYFRINDLYRDFTYNTAILLLKPSNVAKILYNYDPTGKLSYKTAFKIFSRGEWIPLANETILNTYIFDTTAAQGKFVTESLFTQPLNSKTKPEELKNTKYKMQSELKRLMELLRLEKFFGGIEGFQDRLNKYGYKGCNNYNVRQGTLQRIIKNHMIEIGIPKKDISSFVEILLQSMLNDDVSIFPKNFLNLSNTVLILQTRLFLKELLLKNIPKVENDPKEIEILKNQIKMLIGDIDPQSEMIDRFDFNKLLDIVYNKFASQSEGESIQKKPRTRSSRTTRTETTPLIEQEPEIEEAQPIIQKRRMCNLDDPIFVEVKCDPETDFIAGNFVTYADDTCSYMPGFMVYSAKSCDEIKALVNEVLKDEAGDIHQPLKKKFEDRGYQTNLLFSKDLGEKIGSRPGSFKVVKGGDVFFIIMGKKNK